LDTLGISNNKAVAANIKTSLEVIDEPFIWKKRMFATKLPLQQGLVT